MAMNVIDRDSLLGMVAGPLIWAVHFLACYILVAAGCAFGFGTGQLITLDTALVAITAAALVIIAILTLLAWRRWFQAGGFETPRDETQARHRFMALGGLLLCILSGVAVIYVAVPLFFLPVCQ